MPTNEVWAKGERYQKVKRWALRLGLPDGDVLGTSLGVLGGNELG
jgi:hypothetical protein